MDHCALRAYARIMRMHAGLAAMAVIATTLTACHEAALQPVELLPPEVCNWTTGQPISFSPPPDSWKRSRYQNGGAEGVDFVLAGSNGEQIYIAERFFLGRRDRCKNMKEILDNLENLDRKDFATAIQKARLYTSQPYSSEEERSIAFVNEFLSSASQAFRSGDKFLARADLLRALKRASTIHFTVEETVDKVLFTRERNGVYPALKVDEPVQIEVAGVRALAVSFTFNGHSLPMVGRRIYAVENNRMFEFGFQGLEENLPLFERIIESTTFPPGVCEH